jgi:hypothetical protein
MDTKASVLCDECDPPCVFVNKANYNRHRVSEHGYSVKFKCTICKISYSQHTKLQEHLKDKHHASSDVNIKEMSEICLVKPSSATVTSTVTSSTAAKTPTTTMVASTSKESNVSTQYIYINNKLIEY